MKRNNQNGGRKEGEEKQKMVDLIQTVHNIAYDMEKQKELNVQFKNQIDDIKIKRSPNSKQKSIVDSQLSSPPKSFTNQPTLDQSFKFFQPVTEIQLKTTKIKAVTQLIKQINIVLLKQADEKNMSFGSDQKNRVSMVQDQYKEYLKHQSSQKQLNQGNNLFNSTLFNPNNSGMFNSQIIFQNIDQRKMQSLEQENETLQNEIKVLRSRENQYRSRIKSLEDNTQTLQAVIYQQTIALQQATQHIIQTPLRTTPSNKTSGIKKQQFSIEKQQTQHPQTASSQQNQQDNFSPNQNMADHAFIPNSSNKNLNMSPNHPENIGKNSNIVASSYSIPSQSNNNALNIIQSVILK